MDINAPAPDDLRRQIQQLRQQLDTYQSLFTNMTEGFALGEAIVNDQGQPVDFRYLTVNEAFFRQTGLPRDIVGRLASDYLPQLEHSWFERYGGVALTGQPIRFESFNTDTNRHYDVYCYSPQPGRFAILFRDISERVRMEQALRAGDRQHREHEYALSQMIAALPGLVWTATTDAGADFLSRQWQDYTGLPTAQLLGSGWLDVLHPDDRAPIQAAWLRTTRTHANFNTEYRIRRADGVYHWFNARGQPLRNEAGVVVRWFGICTDIDDLKRAQDALVESERRYSALFNNKINGVSHLRVITDARGQPVDLEYEAVNIAYETIVGLRRSEVEGRRITQVFPGFEHLEANLIGLYGNIALHGGENSSELYFPITRQWFLVYVYSHIRGKCTLIFTDITAQKQSEAALRASESQLRATFDQAAVGMAHTAPDGCWLRVNRKFCDMLGYREDELLGRPFGGFTHPDEAGAHVGDGARLARGEIDTFTVEKRYLHKDGLPVWMRVTVSAVRDSAGVHLHNLVVAEDITERRAAEQQRDASEAELSATFEQAAVGIARVGPDGRLLKVNRTLCELLGYTAGELTGRHFRDISAPADRDVGTAEFLRTVHGDSPGFTIEKRYLTRAEKTRWVRITAAPVRHPETGAFKYNVAIVEDITERRHARAELEGFFRQAAVGMAVVDTHGCIQRINQRGGEILGYPQDDLIGRTFQSLTHPDDLSSNVGLFQRLLAGELPEYTLEKRYIRQDGRAVWAQISVSLVREEGGARPYVVTVIQDIDARKHLETELREAHRELELRVEERTAELQAANAALRRQKERLRTVLETASDAYVAVDERGLIVEWNQAAVQLFGWTRDEAVGLSLMDTIIPPRYRADHEHSFARFAETGSAEVMNHRLEFPALHRDGSEFPVEATLNANRVGEHWLINAFLRDITARKAAEAALQQARLNAEAANRAKTDFLATMSHEIRTPLNGVIGFTGLLLDGPLDDSQRHYAELARHSGESLLHLLNDFLDFSKIEAGRLELEPVEFDLHLEAGQVLALVQPGADEKGLTLNSTLNVPHRLRGDAARLRQILLNLLANAVKFTPAGHITLCCSEASREGGQVRICFEVIDTGIGIDPDVRPRLFQPFVQAGAITRRFGGTGLGLAICKRLAEAMGGEIGFRSVPGQGSTFWVELPFELLAAEAVATTDACLDTLQPSHATGHRGRVLVVEDNSVSQLLASEVLKRLGCQVDVAGNGLEAVEACKQLPYDLILMDCDMPVMDGFEATRAIRALEEALNGRRVPIIAMTASALQGDPERCLAAGMDEFMSKPLRLQQISKLVDAWLKPG